MFERFTQGARVLLVLAQEEARVLQHHHIGSEHLLLALVRDDPEQLLSSAGVTLADTRERVLDLVPGKDTPPGGHIPFTASAKAVLEGALREAVEHRHQTIAPLHLLASLLRARKGEGFQVLEQVVDVATLTTAVQARLPELAVEPSRAFAVPPLPEGIRATLLAAQQLSGPGPVGTHHLVRAALSDPHTAAHKAAASAGIDLKALLEALTDVDVTGTSG